MTGSPWLAAGRTVGESSMSCMSQKPQRLPQRRSSVWRSSGRLRKPSGVKTLRLVRQRVGKTRRRSSRPLHLLPGDPAAGLRQIQTGGGLRDAISRRDIFERFLTDGRVEIDSNIVERAIRPQALGRKSWLFAGSDRGADRAAFMATLIMSAKLNDIDPQAWLADVLANIADTPISRLEKLLPWNWTPTQTAAVAA
ncbi:transposase IS66-like protein [Rhizobium laguerreae]|uniref:Transposase IS66-like protein n=1 Tax=Rhizobium laguerreae TaxID=1076926 RepID=A0AAX2QG23_9HYPH|nr:transposase IS66-like protein [Rhizobium laguerreae]